MLNVPHVEVSHLGDLRHVSAGIDIVGAEQEDEVPIDAHEGRVLRMHDEETHHSHRHLHHLVGVRVVHERAALAQFELVDERLARLDVRLRQSTNAVHAIGQQHAVPMNGGVLGQLVGDEDAHLVAFDRLDRRPRGLTVVAPQVCLHAWRHLTYHRLGDEMEFLPVAIHAPRQRPAVQRHHRLVIRPCGRHQRRPASCW